MIDKMNNKILIRNGIALGIVIALFNYFHISRYFYLKFIFYGNLIDSLILGIIFSYSTELIKEIYYLFNDLLDYIYSVISKKKKYKKIVTWKEKPNYNYIFSGIFLVISSIISLINIYLLYNSLDIGFFAILIFSIIVIKAGLGKGKKVKFKKIK